MEKMILRQIKILLVLKISNEAWAHFIPDFLSGWSLENESMTQNFSENLNYRNRMSQKRF